MIWAAIMIGSSLILRSNEYSALILNFLIAGATIDILSISRSAVVKTDCDKQEAAKN